MGSFCEATRRLGPPRRPTTTTRAESSGGRRCWLRRLFHSAAFPSAVSAPSRGSPPTAARPRPESFPPVLPAAAPTLILPEHAAPRDFPTPRKSRQVPSLLLPRISRSPSRSASGRIFHGGSSRGGPRVPTGGFFVVF